MPAVGNPLERLREQQAQRLLEALQSDLRAQIRLEDDDVGRRGRHQPPRSAQKRLQEKIVRLTDPRERERIWGRVVLPMFRGIPINDLPKTREFWATVDVTTWTRGQLDMACELLDLPSGGRKTEMVARLQDWVHAPALRRQRELAEQQEREREALLASGRVFACGSNFHGELGLGDRRSRATPTEIEHLRGERITDVIAGYDADFAFAIAADGRLFAWGGGGRAWMDVAGQSERPGEQQRSKGSRSAADPAVLPVTTAAATAVVTGTESPSSCFLLPRLVPQFHGHRVSQVACGRADGHVAIATNDGACFTWGRGEYGELGVEGDAKAMALAEKLQPAEVTSGFTPHTVARARIATVSVGNCHTAAVTTDGELFVWGACWSGQLGLGVTTRKGVSDRRRQLYFPTPTPVEAFSQRSRVRRVSCGAVHTGVITADGQLFTFGCGDGGRLGLGGNADAAQPELVTALARDVVVDVVCCNWHSLCLVQTRGEHFADPGEGFVFAFGNGLHGQLGLGKQKIAALPTRVTELVHRRVRCVKIAASAHHSCALSTDGRLFTWGQNAGGCLGRPTVDGGADSPDPEVIAGFSDFGVGPITSIACGHRFTIFATGPWEPLEPRPQYELNERLNRHPKFPAY